MSVSLGVYKGKNYYDYDCELVDDRPVSFQRVWNRVWDRAIAECKIRIFDNCRHFSVSQIPEVLEELDRIYEWVQINGGEDTNYISERIHDELKPFLIQFYREHKDEDYWLDLG